ncbi:NADH-quinone oxidoreductase subunit B family protein [Acidithiobacillus ferridurans]|uniref:NADH-quinone oxidoreductase subunit B family protein n=1 Tax=Acidithiobacillus ferridurans TaxID=1232575 RepID=UPI0029C00DB2|nr:hydrogenase [Acidithiobacillus ferridurans]
MTISEEVTTMANVLWLQGGACSGNTMSFLNAEEPSACDLVSDFGINVLWHPSLGMDMGDNLQKLLRDCVSGAIPLDIFVFEGTVVNAPNGTGTWNRFAGRPMKDWVKELSGVAQFVVALGDCATWGGIPATAPNPSDSKGLQFLKKQHGGFLGAGFKSKAGLPVVNIPGCPAHPDWVTQVLVAVATGRAGELELDDLQRPKTFFKSFTQTGCTRNMHFAYKVSATEFGQRKGCLFYDLGCRGPMTHSPCNRILWNRQSSKTRAGMPCLGCTEPEFPFFDLAPGSVFKTQTVMGVPKDLPEGVDKSAYIKLTSAAKSASPAWAEKDIFVV